MKGLLMILAAMGLASCAVEEERKPVLPESAESELPWNRMQPGEGQGMFGAMQSR
ncbi:MAG: hypothetical protein Q7Q71_02655 [Verrucomicrobiota bacterium JB023]|nr:hypothetical protein [Verrucomicrobiota bacterium JB023]